MLRCRWMAGALLSVAAVAAPAATTAAGLDPIVAVSVFPGRDFTQGEWLQINLSVVPPADAAGDLTALVDGLGATDGFVQRMWRSDFDCPYRRLPERNAADAVRGGTGLLPTAAPARCPAAGRPERVSPHGRRRARPPDPPLSGHRCPARHGS